MADSLPLNDLLDFALDAAWQAGRITLGYFQTGVAVERKSDDSPVTRADRESEQRIRDLIQKQWPNHGIIGEEFGKQAGKEGLTWIVDPIDGTKSFVCGVPMYAVLIALADGERGLVGVAHFPALNETIYAVQDGGCFWDGRRCHVSSVDDLSKAVLLSSEVIMGHGKDQAWERLCKATSMRRTWGDSYGYALVATGRAEIMCDSIMNLWDCGPFGVIMEEAGGTFTDWKGNATIYTNESLATNGALLQPALKVIGNT